MESLRPHILVALVVVGVATAALSVWAPGAAVGIAVGSASLLPLAAHLRNVGWRRALHANWITAILIFYLLVYPLRAVVIAANHGSDVFLTQSSVSGGLLAQVLLGASGATTLLIEAYYLAAGAARSNHWEPVNNARHAATTAGRAASRRLVRCAVILEVASLAAVGEEIRRAGFSAAQHALADHNKLAALSSSASSVGSAWQIFAGPSVWVAAFVLVRPGIRGKVKLGVGGLAVVLLVAQIVVYGSRLNVILSLIGAWIVCYHCGRIPSAKLLTVGLVALVAVSFPLIAERADGLTQTKLPVAESLSRIVGYDILDTALAIHQRPSVLRSDLEDPSRWLNVEEYLVPGFAWSGRPNIQGVRMDLYTALSLGTVNDAATGFPASFMTELWLYGGWLAVAIAAVCLGLLLGSLTRALLTRRSATCGPPILATLASAFVATSAFTYYKDGDVLVSVVGLVRDVIYLGIVLVVSGFCTNWSPRAMGEERAWKEHAS